MKEVRDNQRVQLYTYAYDQAGNVKSEYHEDLDAVSVDTNNVYTYDADGQLIKTKEDYVGLREYK